MGYTADHRILFAGHYGVPQMRFRTIFIGALETVQKLIFQNLHITQLHLQTLQGLKSCVLN